jgi:hypothetical protein
MLDDIFRIGYLRGMQKQAMGAGLPGKPALFPTIKGAPNPLKPMKLPKMPASATMTGTSAISTPLSKPSILGATP